jgi:hypothetical protein
VFGPNGTILNRRGNPAQVLKDRLDRSKQEIMDKLQWWYSPIEEIYEKYNLLYSFKVS